MLATATPSLTSHINTAQAQVRASMWGFYSFCLRVRLWGASGLANHSSMLLTEARVQLLSY